jgi:hypothetical protein
MEDADWAAGKLNNCLVFNMDAGETNEYVNLGAIGGFEYNQPFSIECWYICNSDASEYTIISKKETSGNWRGWDLKIFYGYPYIHYQSTTTLGIQKRTTSKYVDANWHHLVVTYNGNGLSTGIIFYIDGSPVAMTTNQNNNGTNTWINTINCQLGGHNAIYCYKGSLDEVLIYNKVLSAAEVTTRYNSGSGTETLDFTQALSENLGTVEVVSRQVDFIRQYNESLGLADAYSRQIDFIRLYSETLGLSDSFARTVAFIRLMTENLSLSDIEKIDLYKPLIENLALSDEFSRTVAFSRLLTEILALSDLRSYSINKKLTELISLLDSLSRQVAYKRTLPEGITLSGVEKEAFSKLLKETMTLTSSLKKEVNKQLKQTLHLVDVYSRIVTYKRTFPETLHLVGNRKYLFTKSPLEEILFLYGNKTKIEFRKKILESLILTSTRNLIETKKLLETLTLTLNTPPFYDPPNTINVQVNLYSDDCTRYPTSVELIDIIEQGAGMQSGMRFQNIQIPKGATILSAYLKIKSNYTPDEWYPPYNTLIRGQKSPNASTFVASITDYDNRPRTTAEAIWSIMTWNSGVLYTSSDIKTIAQEIIDQSAWMSGNSMAFFWFGGSKLLGGYSFDYPGSPPSPPQLEITYKVPSGFLKVGKNLKDTLNLVDSKTLTSMKKLSQVLSFSDKRIFRVDKKLKEILTLLDQINRSIVFLRFLTETLNLDSHLQLDTSKSLLETLSLMEEKQIDFVKMILETLTLEDKSSKNFFKDLKEHLFVVEDFKKTVYKLLKENMSFSDTVQLMAFFIMYVIGDILLGYPKISRNIIKLSYSKLQRNTMLLARRIQRITAKFLKRRRVKKI